MAETDTEILANGTGALSEEDERMKQRPADIDADVREMERRKRVEALMSSKLFREELERVLDQQMHEGADAPLLQRIKEMVGGRLHTGSFRGPSCVLPINDIRGIEGVGYEKGEKILRCKLAALYRLVDLFGWTQCGVASQLTARLNTAVEQLLISPRGLMPHEVTASSLLKVDMQGTVIDSGTTNYGVHKAGFSVHAAVHAARPDVRCVLHLRSPPVLAISATKTGLLPLCTEAALIGDVAYHRVPTGILDNEERDKIVRVLGPSCKILFLRSQGALCCGSTLEEAFYHAKHLHTAADVQLKLATVPRDQLAVMDDEERKEVYDAARAEGAAESNKWRAGGEEFEALMRMLDNAGFRTGYIYRNPLVKNDVPRPKNDVEVPPAVSSLGYLLEEEEMYRQGLWKKGQGKTGERTRWLNSPNVYQKVEVLETGTNDPKKITKWVDANNEEWVQDGSPAHSSTPMKIDAALQFVPKNTNPKEFKALQQQIKDNRRADKISAGPQSHILEGVTWDEANRLNAEDASATHAGDHVVLVGAASKGIIQRGYQHNATVYSAPYARNPFEHVSERDLDEYTRRVTGQNNYDTDLSESEAISAAQMTSPVSETEDESRDEHRVLRIETKQAPMRSQPEVVLSDDTTDFLNAERSHVDRTRGVGQNPKLTQSPNPSSANKNRDYPRCPNFETLILKYETPKNDPKCKVNLKKRYDSEPTNAYAVEMCNPGHFSSLGSLNSVPSIEWDIKKADNNFRSQSLPRKLGRKEQQQRYYRSCSHAGFINTFIRNPEPVHYHMPKCRKCGSFNSSYDWEITKRDLRSLGQSSIWHSYENIHQGCLREGGKKVLAICDVVRVKEMDAPVFDVNKEFIDSEEYNEDCYLENTYLSNSTVVENDNLNRTLVEAEAAVADNNVDAEIPLESYKAFNIVTDIKHIVKTADVTSLNISPEDKAYGDRFTIDQEVLSEKGVDENGIFRAECVYIETSGESSKSESRKSSNNSPEANKVNTDIDVLVTQEKKEVFEVDTVQEQVLGVEAIVISEVVKSTEKENEIYQTVECENSEIIEQETRLNVDSSVYRVFRSVLKEFKSKFYRIDAVPETQVDFTVDNMEGEYLNFTNELDFDRAVYDSPVKSLITKDVRDFLVPLDFYNDVKESPSKFNKSAGNILETIAEETKVSDSSNDSVKDSSGEKETDQSSFDAKVASKNTNSKNELDIISDAINAKSAIIADDNASKEDGVNEVDIDNEEQNVKFPVCKSSVVDLSCLEVCENFKISIESSSNEIPSFDSTAEFEKIEVVADVLGVLIKRVSIAIVNKDENDFYKTVDEALKIKHKGVKFFDMSVPQKHYSIEGPASIEVESVGFDQEPEALIESEQTSSKSNDINHNQAGQSVGVLKNDNKTNCKEEIFSIVEIVQSIDQEIVGYDFTVLSEDSDLDPKTHPFKVCESIVYHILCTVYCQIKHKCKTDKRNGKAVVTVADVEDIMFTALPIWNIVSINRETAQSDNENEEVKPIVEDERLEPYFCSRPFLGPKQIIDNEAVSSDKNNETSVVVTESEVQTSAEKEILIEKTLSEAEVINIIQDALEPTEPVKNKYMAFGKNIGEFDLRDEDKTNNLITVTVVDNAVNKDDFTVFQQAEYNACLKTSSQVGVIASTTTTLETNLYTCETNSNVAANELDLHIAPTIDSASSSENICKKELNNDSFTENPNACLIETKDKKTQPESYAEFAIERNEKKEINALQRLFIHDIRTEKLAETLAFRVHHNTHSVQSISAEELMSSNIDIIPVINAQEDAIYESKLNAVTEINRIVSNITNDEKVNVTSPSCHKVSIGQEPDNAPKESKLISEEISRIMSNMPYSTANFEGDYASCSNSHTVPVSKEQEDATKESKLIAKEGVYATSPNTVTPENNKHDNAIKEIQLIAVEEIVRIISNIPDCTREWDQDCVINVNSDLPMNDTIAELKSVEHAFSNLNPNAAPFIMKNFQAKDTTNEENEESNTYINISSSDTVKLDVNDILDEVLEVVSSMYDRYSNENTYSVSPVTTNESIEGICVDDCLALMKETIESELEVTDDKEEKEPFKITIDVSKSLEESRKLNQTHNREEANTCSPDDDCIVLDVYDTKSFGTDEEKHYVTELKSAIQGYATEYDAYNDSLNGSNEDNEELYIEKHGTPKFVDLVTRDEDGSIDSITYNSHILQTIVENLLQDVISEFVIDDNVSEIINTEVSQDTEDNSQIISRNLVERGAESSSFVKFITRSKDLAVVKNETFVLGTENNLNTSENETSFADMAYESCSKTDLDQTYVLGTELAKDNSDLTEVSYFDTAFCEDTMLTNQSSPYKNDSPMFTSCDESPIKIPNTAYLDDTMLYDKCDVSPFDKTAAVLSMSQCVNAGGVKYWLSFDGSFTEMEDKAKTRGKKSRDIPTFYSFETVNDLPERGSNNSNLLKLKTSDSSIYMTATGSKSKNDASTSYNPEPSTSKDQNESRLIFDCSKRSKNYDCPNRSKKSGRREYNTWPPYDESLFYRIISNFRMSESFDLSDLDNVEHR